MNFSSEQMKIIIATLLLLQLISPNSASECTEECGDFHRICPALKNSGYLAQLDQEEIQKQLRSSKDLPTPIECSNLVYTVLCPQSCGLCVPCAKNEMAAMAEELKKLTSDLNGLRNDFETAKATTKAPSPALIPVITGSAPGCLDNNPDSWDVHLSWDKNPNTIYHSATNQGGWAKYFIPESLVTSVKLKNRADCCGERMTGNIVWVCSATGCSKCGTMGTVGNGQWGTLTCPEGMRGNAVKVTAPFSYLQIAQIEIYGMAQQQSQRVDIITAQSSSLYGGDYKMPKSWDGNPNTFYHSKKSKKGEWIKYQIAPANVRIVRVQNRANCCSERMTGTVVYVCADQSDASCQECGRFGVVAKKQWGVVECGEGIQGSYVKIMLVNNYIQIAEIQIYSNV